MFFITIDWCFSFAFIFFFTDQLTIPFFLSFDYWGLWFFFILSFLWIWFHIASFYNFVVIIFLFFFYWIACLEGSLQEYLVVFPSLTLWLVLQSEYLLFFFIYYLICYPPFLMFECIVAIFVLIQTCRKLSVAKFALILIIWVENKI